MTEIGGFPLAALPQEMDLDVEHNPIAVPAGKRVSQPNASGSRRKEISKEQWEELKRFIRHLYLDEKMTREAVTKCIVQKYNFEPTKRQFLRKISEWKFEKNVKKLERKSILLDYATGRGDIEPRTRPGRVIDKAKIERWSRRDGILLQNPGLGNDRMQGTQSSTTQSFDEKIAHDIFNLDHDAGGDVQTPNVPQGEEIDIDLQAQLVTTENTPDLFNPWAMVDIIGSPKLTGLFGVLTIYECDSLSLDFSSSESNIEKIFDATEENPSSNAVEVSAGLSSSTAITTTGSSKRNRHFSTIPQWATQNSPSFGISPFPTSTTRTKLQKYDFFPSRKSPRLTEFECEAKMRRLKNKQHVDSLEFVDSMWFIAYRYYDNRDCCSAELWFRRIVRATTQPPTRHTRQLEVMRACLWIVTCVSEQGRHAEARDLHQSLHESIMHLVGSDPGHWLVFESRKELASSLRYWGEIEEAEQLWRELLQIQLNKFGVTDHRSLECMSELGTCLTDAKQYSGSKQLWHTLLHIKTQVPGYSLPNVDDRKSTFEIQVQLATTLSRSGTHSEAEALFKHVEELFSDMLRIQDSWSFEYNFELAATWIRQRRFDEGEKVLQELLHHQECFIFTNKRVNVMSQLENIADAVGRDREAVSWSKKIYSLNVETFGLEHKYSMTSCRKLGFNYSDQGLFDEALFHFEQAISKIELLPKKDGDDSPNESIQKIRRWIAEVNMRRCYVIGFEFSNRGLFDEAILHFEQAISKIELLPKEGDPSPTESIKMIQRWIARVTIDQYKVKGFGLADQGLFDEAILHFEQALKDIPLDATGGDEDLEGSYTDCIERIRRWISNVVVVQMASCKEVGFNYMDEGQFEDAIRHFQQAIAKIESVEVGDGNIDTYDGCVVRIQCWLSTIYAQKSLDSCWLIGRGYADDGLFDEATLHFQEALDDTDPAEEIETHDPSECIQILKDWIEDLQEEKAQSVGEAASVAASGGYHDDMDGVERDVEMVEEVPFSTS